MAALAAARDHLSRFVAILKQIGAISGQRVGIRNAVICIDGAAVVRALDEDGNARSLTPWQHCEGLGVDELFRLNATNPGSFDIRYFGPIDASFVRGRVISLMTEELQ